MDEIGVFINHWSFFSELYSLKLNSQRKNSWKLIFPNRLLGCISLEVPVQRSDSTATRVEEDCATLEGLFIMVFYTGKN